ncbi:MAG: C25 family cysteine peptidase [Thermoprotei archaeon]
MDWYKRVWSKLLVFSIIITVVLSQISVVVGNNNISYEYMLERLGIEVPDSIIDNGVVAEYSIVLDDFKIEQVADNYVTLVVDSRSLGSIEYFPLPGKPMIPYITYTFTVNGYVESASIAVKPLSVKAIRLTKEIAPTPQPLPYYPILSNKLEYVKDEEVYSSDEYFPGNLASIEVFHGLLGKSIVSVKIYPVQYNPVKGEAILINKLRIYISYSKPVYKEFNTNSLLIITKRELVDLLSTTLAEFYRNKGYNVTIVDTDYIYENYSPAPNITEYPGFYNPPVEDEIYMTLVENYNYTLALKIISYLNYTLGNYSHVLLVGNALDVPPSFYYMFMPYKIVEVDTTYQKLYDSWIPTDLFYADLDRDLVPDLFVGRIPFSDEESVKQVVNKIIAWYDSPASKSNKLYMSGGYPFGLSLMFGETALSTMVLSRDTWSFDTILLTRTSYNYTRDIVYSILQGEANALWYFLLAHGDGASFADLIATPEWLTFEILITSWDILFMKPNPSVPIVSSVACINAAWDVDLVTPLWFKPPSIGQAILLSPAGGIAYIGSARTAYEIVGPFIIKDGVIYNSYYGASLLHRLIISTYNKYRLMGMNVSLGQVVAEGISQYLLRAPVGITSPIDIYIIVSEIMKLSLLGDPLLELPIPSDRVEKPWIDAVKSVNPAGYLDSEIIFYMSKGEVPLYRPYTIGEMNLIGGGTANVTVIVNRIMGSPYSLYYHYLLGVEETSLEDGSGLYETAFDANRSGKVLIKFSIPGWGEIRYLAASAGLTVTPPLTTPGGLIRVEGFGLDILGYIEEAELVVAGRIVTRIYINTTTGYLNWSLAMPYTAPGRYAITLALPRYYYDPELLATIYKLLVDYVTVYSEEALDVKVLAPYVLELGDKAVIAITTLYNGAFVDVNISMSIVDPDGALVEYNVSRIDTGTYILEFTVEKVGIYRVAVEANYTSAYTIASGASGTTILVVDKLYNIGEHISRSANETQQLIKLVNMTLTAGIVDIVDGIHVLNDKTVVIDTKLGEITGKLVEINDNILAVNTTAGVLFIRLDQLEQSVTGDIDQVRQEISGAREDISSSINEVKSSINKVKSDMQDIATILEVMIGVLYVGLALLGVSIAKLVKK